MYTHTHTQHLGSSLKITPSYWCNIRRVRLKGSQSEALGLILIAGLIWY